MEIDNCVVCGKYLKDIGEQEQGMCNKCDNKTDAIAKEQDKALIIDDVSKSFYCGNEALNISRCTKQCLTCINDMNTEHP